MRHQFCEWRGPKRIAHYTRGRLDLPLLLVIRLEFPGLKKFARFVMFLSQSAVVGLAAAFVIVYINPDWLPKRGSGQTGADLDLPATTPGQSSYSEAVNATRPAVVSIYAKRVSNRRERPYPVERLFSTQDSGMRDRVERSLGSGVVIDSDGHIVTNHHVIVGASEIQVQLFDGRVTIAEVVGTDPDTDIALLRIPLTGLTEMRLGRSATLQIGDVVLAIGNPFGLGHSVSFGIVSATGRGQLGLFTFENFIQTDADINFGNSGGALVNASGLLIGINTAVLSPSLLPEGIGFAIPVDLVTEIVNGLIKDGWIIRGWLGVVPSDLTRGELRDPRTAAVGIRLDSVAENSPAFRAGLRAGDIITHINDQPIRFSQEALNLVASLTPGTEVTITGSRDGTGFEVRAQVIERPLY